MSIHRQSFLACLLCMYYVFKYATFPVAAHAGDIKNAAWRLLRAIKKSGDIDSKNSNVVSVVNLERGTRGSLQITVTTRCLQRTTYDIMATKTGPQAVSTILPIA